MWKLSSQTGTSRGIARNEGLLRWPYAGNEFIDVLSPVTCFRNVSQKVGKRIILKQV
jgi:hypothetical protein